MGTSMRPYKLILLIGIVCALSGMAYSQSITKLSDPSGHIISSHATYSGDYALDVHVNDLEDKHGFDAENSTNGESRVSIPILLVGRSFEGTTIDPNFWATTISSGATITQANGLVTLSSNTTNGSAVITSVRRARYVPGQSHIFRTHVALTSAGVSSNTRSWGIAYGSTFPTTPTKTDAALFSMVGTTFSIVTMKSGASTTVSSGSFNGKLGSTYDPGLTIHTYEIYWNNRHVYFMVDGTVLHTVTPTTSWSDTTQFYIYSDNINSNGTSTNSTMVSSVAGIRRFGTLLNQPTSKYQSGTTTGVVLKYGTGNIHGIAIGGITDNSVVTLCDAVSAGTNTIYSTGTMVLSATSNNLPFFIDLKGMAFYTGLTLVIETASSTVTVMYE